MELTLKQLNDQKILKILVREIGEIKRRLDAIKDGRIIEELKLTEDNLIALGLVDLITKEEKRGYRSLSEADIKEAQSQCNTAVACAKFLNVNYLTYRRWAEKYNLFKVNPWGMGSRKKCWIPDKGKHPLNQILDGKFPDYPIHRLKDLLFKSKIKNRECESCGFRDERLTDSKMPIILSFKDNNPKNHKLENLEILCYNCMFLVGRGYLRKGKVEFNSID